MKERLANYAPAFSVSTLVALLVLIGFNDQAWSHLVLAVMSAIAGIAYWYAHELDIGTVFKFSQLFCAVCWGFTTAIQVTIFFVLCQQNL